VALPREARTSNNFQWLTRRFGRKAIWAKGASLNFKAFQNGRPNLRRINEVLDKAGDPALLFRYEHQELKRLRNKNFCPLAGMCTVQLELGPGDGNEQDGHPAWPNEIANPQEPICKPAFTPNIWERPEY
jgi:hypothetical protein